MTRAHLLFSLLILVGVFVGCTIRPPDENIDLGPEVSASDVTNSLLDAQSGITAEKSFRLGDNAHLQVTDRIFSSSSVEESHFLEVTKYDDTEIDYYDLNQTSGTVQQFVIARKSDTATGWIKNTKIYAYIEKAYRKVNALVAKLTSKVSIGPSSALGEVPKSPALGPVQDSVLSQSAVHALINKQLNQYVTTSSSSKYYGLKVSPHQFNITNLAQPIGPVNATRIEYNEMRTDAKGTVSRIHWLYEISSEVPGIISVLNECLSTMVTQNQSQFPLSRCSTAIDFKFGVAH